MAKLESLIVDLQANTANLEKGLNAANAKLKDFDNQIKGLLGLVALKKIGEEALAVGAQVAAFVGKSIDALDAYGKKAKLTGDTAEELSRVGYAFQQTGVSADEFSKFTTKLGESLSKAAAGGEEQRALFQALGVSATDASGNVRKTTSVIGDLSKKFAELKDGPAKAQLAIELFGKGGEAMVETLNKGSAALEAAGAEADRFGQTVTTEAADGAGKFNDGLEQLSSMVDGFGKQLAADILPTLNKVLDAFLNNAGGIDLMRSALKGVGELFKTLGFAASVFASVWDELVLVIKDAATAFLKLQQFDIAGALQSAASMERGIKKLGDAAVKAGEDFYAPAAAGADAAQSQTKSAEAVLRGATRAKAAMDAQKKAAQEAKAALVELTRVAEGFEVQLETFGQNDPVAEMTARIDNGDLSEKFAKIGDAAGAMKDRILSAVASLQDLSDQKFSHELKLTIETQQAGLARSTQQHEQQARLASLSPDGANKALTAGFFNRAQAMDRYVEQMQVSFALAAKAAQAGRDNNVDAQHSYQQLQVAAENAAGDSLKAADAFDEMQRIAREKVKTKLSGIAQVFAQGATQLLGPLGDLVNSIAQGAEKGGVWGAIIAAFMEIAKRTASALHFVDVAMEFISELAQMVEPLIRPVFEALTNVLGVILQVVAPIFTALQPLFEAFSSAISGLAPILYAVGDLFKGLAPILEFIGHFVQVLIDITKPFNELLAGVIKVVATVLLGIIIAFNELAAAFGDKKAAEESKRLQKVVADIWASNDSEAQAAAQGAKLQRDTAINKGIEAAKSAADKAAEEAYRKAIEDGASFQDAQAAANAASRKVTDDAAGKAAQAFDEAVAAGSSYADATTAAVNAVQWSTAAYEDNADKTKKATDAIADFTQSLTNVPQGFKYAAAAFDAQGFGSDAVFGPGDQRRNITLEIDGEKLADVMDRITKRRTFRRNGFGG